MDAHVCEREGFVQIRVLTFVTRSEIMTMAHSFRRKRLKERAKLQFAIKAGRGASYQRELDAWQPMSMSEALREAWASARLQAELCAVDQATGPAVDRLRAIETQITQLDGRTRWQSSHYAAMADLRAQQAAAFQAVRASLSPQGGQQLPA